MNGGRVALVVVFGMFGWALITFACAEWWGWTAWPVSGGLLLLALGPGFADVLALLVHGGVWFMTTNPPEEDE